MFMQHVPRIMLLPFFAAGISGGAWAKEDGSDVDTSKASEYKRSDSNYYLRSDIVKVTPGAVIIPKGDYTQQDDSYFFTPKIKPPKTMQVEVINDWIEPITPPDAPPTLSIPPDAMQIREPQGDVRVALPTAPTDFAPVTDGMMVPNGAVLKTGLNSTVAVLFGGVDSARLMPNSAAAVQQTVTATSRLAEVDLTAGGVFSKVGQQVGVKGEYEVHTRFGNAVARGTDFVTIATPTHTDVWIAQGTVSLEPPESKASLMATSDGTGTLKVIRFPQIADPKQSLLADAESLTAVFDFIPAANQKIASLRAKKGRGEVLTASEQDYLHRIKQVPSLIKLTLVEKAPPPAPAPPAAIVREPAAEGSPTIAPPAPAAVDFILGPADQIHLASDEGPNAPSLSEADLKTHLADLAKSNPHVVVLSKEPGISPTLVKKVVDAIHEVKLKAKIIHPKKSDVSKPVAPATKPAAETSSSPQTEEPAVPAPRAAPVAAKTTTPPAPSSRTAPAGPMTVLVQPNGTIKFQSHTLTQQEFQKKLKVLIKKNPEQELVIQSGTKVPYDKLKATLDSCAATQVRHLTVASPAPAPPPAAPSTPPATETSAANLPAPALLMHPTMQSMSSNAPPVAPAETAPTPPSGP